LKILFVYRDIILMRTEFRTFICSIILIFSYFIFNSIFSLIIQAHVSLIGGIDSILIFNARLLIVSINVKIKIVITIG